MDEGAGQLFEAELVLTFPAFDQLEAEAKVEEALDYLYDEGFEVIEDSIVIQESVEL